MTFPQHTERLILRRPTADDTDEVYTYQRLPEVAKYLYRPPWTRERTAEILAADAVADFADTGDNLLLLVERRDTPGVIGEVILKYASRPARQAEIGWVFHPDHGGHGYATEAAKHLLGLAFTRYDFHRVFARLDEENTGSWRICERLGMRREARLVEADVRDGVWGTELVYAILASEHETAA